MTINLRMADAVIANTDCEAKRLESVYGVPAERIFTGWLGSDLPSTSFNNGVRPRKVLFLGRKVLEKGLADLLEAMKEVWEDLPDAELILAGARTTRTTEVDRLIAGLSENQFRRIRSLDNISEDEKNDLLAEAACLVLPSRFESFGMVLLEAWAQATPVIALDLPVFRSIVSPRDDGLLVPPGDIHALANAILLLLKDSELAVRMGRTGRVKVEQRFTWDKVTSHYLQAYEFAVQSCKMEIN